jgi:spermidine synthase
MLDPLNLSMEYTRLIFSSLLFFPDLASIKRILIIGLGGGAFYPLIRKYLPLASLDVVEIDEMVVDLARRYFKFQESPKTNIYIDDIRNYIEKSDQRYDLVLSDPFFLGEVPIHLRTAEYYQNIKEILNDQGVFSGNIVLQAPCLAGEIKAVKNLFPSSYLFVGKTDNAAIIACNSPQTNYSKDDIIKTAKRLEHEHRFSFRLTELAQSMEETVSDVNAEILTDENKEISA